MVDLAHLPGSNTMPDYEPRYRRVFDDLKGQIHGGRLPPGSQLPSTTELAAQYGVGQSTVRTAITLLRELGLVRGEWGVGVFVADGPPNGSPTAHPH